MAALQRVLDAFFKSLHGRELGIGSRGELVAHGKEVTRPCVDCSITVGAEGASVADRREITIQLKDAEGRDIAYKEMVHAFVMADANGDAFAATGGSTGIAIGVDGALLAMVAKKAFILLSEDDGDIDLTWLDTGTEVAYLALRLPNGRIIVSDALTNA